MEKGYENKPKFSWGGGGEFFHGLFRLLKKCSFFFTLTVHDKMVNEYNFEKYSVLLKIK